MILGACAGIGKARKTSTEENISTILFFLFLGFLRSFFEGTTTVLVT